MRKKYPCLKTVAVEVKKKKAITFTKDYTLSDVKYCYNNGKRLVFASKIPAPKRWKKLQAKFAKMLKCEKSKIKRERYIKILVTVELSFFKELWESWLSMNARKENE